MEKSSHSSGGDSSVTTSTFSGGTNSTSISNHRDVFLNHLNKISHKISKPIRRPPLLPPPSGFPQNPNFLNPSPPPPPPPQPLNQPGGIQSQAAPPQQQPPVYNINKSDFRDVVQRLTGSPAHERMSAPPPIQQPKPQSSRLQRIRPPPLAQISNRPPPNVMNCSGPPVNPAGVGFFCGQRQPLSPLPPLPSVHAAAESPISAYMRFLHSSMSSSTASPRWNSVLPPPLPPAGPFQQQNIPPPTQTSMSLPPFPTFPSSPLPFGCVPSPRSGYPLLSPSSQLGFQQLPLSPTVPVPSPKWKGI